MRKLHVKSVKKSIKNKGSNVGLSSQETLIKCLRIKGDKSPATDGFQLCNDKNLIKC